MRSGGREGERAVSKDLRPEGCGAARGGEPPSSSGCPQHRCVQDKLAAADLALGVSWKVTTATTSQ